jgi:hypothetical protein
MQRRWSKPISARTVREHVSPWTAVGRKCWKANVAVPVRSGRRQGRKLVARAAEPCLRAASGPPRRTVESDFVPDGLDDAFAGPLELEAVGRNHASATISDRVPDAPPVSPRTGRHRANAAASSGSKPPRRPPGPPAQRAQQDRTSLCRPRRLQCTFVSRSGCGSALHERNWRPIPLTKRRRTPARASVQDPSSGSGCGRAAGPQAEHRAHLR